MLIIWQKNIQNHIKANFSLLLFDFRHYFLQLG
nr:MAG TPA: hypothetical protein [Caudoviricetes sp.]